MTSKNLRLALRLLLLALFALCTISSASETINICLSMTFEPASSLRASLGAEARRGLTFLTEWLDGKGGFVAGNKTHRFNFVYSEDGGDQGRMIVTEPANRLLLAHNAAADAFNLGRNKAFPIMPAASRYLTAAFVEARVRDVKNISVAMSTFPHHVASCGQLPTKLAPDYGVNVSSIHIIPENAVDYVMDPATIPNITATAEAIMKVGADAVILCSFSSNNKFMVDYWKSKNYLPKMIVINGFGILPYLNWTNREYVGGVESWDSSARYPADKFFGTMDNLLELWRARWPQNNLAFASMNALYTGIALMEAIQRARTIEEDAVTFALSRLDIDTLKGRIAWSGDRTQLGLAVYMQTLGGEWVTVGPIAARTRQLVYPMPTWDEREYVARPYSLSAEYGVTVLFVAGVLSNVIFFIGLIKYWRHPITVASSPVFLLLILIGTTVLYSTIWVWMPSLVSAASCHLRFWMLVGGFGLTFGSLFAKTWRIWTLYNNSNTKGVFAITDGQLAIVVFIVVGIEILLCVLISAVANPYVNILVRDPIRPALNIPLCSTGTAQSVLSIILAVYNGIIILYGIYLAVRVRVIPFSVYNESRQISFSIYNASFFSIIMAILQVSDASDRVTLFVLMAIALFLGSLGTTAPLFLSKYLSIRKVGLVPSGSMSRIASGNSPATARGSFKSGSSQNNQSASPMTSVAIPTEEHRKKDQDEIAKLKKKNKRLRQRVKQLEEELAAVDLQSSDSSVSSGQSDVQGDTSL